MGPVLRLMFWFGSKILLADGSLLTISEFIDMLSNFSSFLAGVNSEILLSSDSVSSCRLLAYAIVKLFEPVAPSLYAFCSVIVIFLIPRSFLPRFVPSSERHSDSVRTGSSWICSRMLNFNSSSVLVPISDFLEMARLCS